jgi:hypothetical protein
MNGLPGADAMTDTLDFVRNMWGSMKIPGMAMPSLSPEEINKQITDLKAVESWLQLNMNMLRSSIQALEVQSATMTALHAMSQSFSQAASGKSEDSDKPIFESPFAAFTAAQEKPAEAPAAPAAESKAGAGLPDPAELAAQFANPAAWWNVVQDQFSQAVNKVVTPPVNKTARKTAAKKTTTTARKKAAPVSATRKKK